MTAREKFSKGRRVKLSAEGLRHFQMSRVLGAGTRGTVVGYGRDPHIVKIQRDDVHTIASYCMSFWEPAPEQIDLPLPTE